MAVCTLAPSQDASHCACCAPLLPFNTLLGHTKIGQCKACLISCPLTKHAVSYVPAKVAAMDKNHLDPSSAQSKPHEKEASTEYLPKSDPVMDRSRGPKKLVLCFDGTGNKFNGDDSDSNILKIFRVLDREADDQFHYYQPGIGTYVISGSLSHNGIRSRFSSWYQKAKDSAVGSSFDHHVVGGYRFLMRYYNSGDEIYMFGFSRGAYIARFLAEMLDNIGLLSHGNEEMVRFAWKTFSQWQCRGGNSKDDNESQKDGTTRELFRFMKGFRETFSRPVGRIRFLGLFDTVNSVPRFETAWMQRSKFPYTARSTAKVIRHAVSIDERRAKFRQDLMYQDRPKHRHRHHVHVEDILERHHHHNDKDDEKERPKSSHSKATQDRGRGENKASPEDEKANSRKSISNEYGPYRSRSKSRQRPRAGGQADSDTYSNTSGVPASDAGAVWDDDEGQDIDEVWFSGGHGDIGGGWEPLPDGKSASHVPLVWMIREAMRAGLPFDTEKLECMGCMPRPGAARTHDHEKANGNKPEIPDIRVATDSDGHLSPVGPPSPDETLGRQATEVDFHKMMHGAHTAKIHDSLTFGAGLPWHSVSAWRIMEWLPFRRMDLREDGSWSPIRWPLPRGEVRDIPHNVRVHGSVIRRLREDETYRPGNLIIGGGGRGVRVAPEEYGIGEWKCVAEHGDPIGEVWMRKQQKSEE
ncbi:hypothetical protein HJFPF1_09434 [Paramyrothecium foliicola]|nr:hypothetical protein HJFPF1_09434 [Paramyrothecium foliicola]